MKKLISIILASNRPQNLSQLLSNLQETADDPSCIEVLVKIDEGDLAMQHCMETVPDIYKLQVRFLQSPRGDGYYTLHHGYNALWAMSNPETYFVLAISDEVRLVTKGWDTILRNYIGLFPDDLFRLKLSIQKYRNYYHFYDCGPCPENFCIMTRRWMEMTEGFGDCWGPDAWCQNIDYHLGLMYDASAFRSVPMHEIRIGGEEAGLGLSPEAAKKRTRRIFQEWWRLCTPPVQQEFRRVAAKMFAYISAHSMKLGEFILSEDKERQCFMVHQPNGPMPVRVLFYHISPSYVRWVNFTQLMRAFRQNQGLDYGVLWAYIKPHKESGFFPVKYARRAICTLSVVVAFFASFLPSFNSRPARLWEHVRIRVIEQLFSWGCVYIKKTAPLDQVSVKMQKWKLWLQPAYCKAFYGDKKHAPVDPTKVIFQTSSKSVETSSPKHMAVNG